MGISNRRAHRPGLPEDGDVNDLFSHAEQYQEPASSAPGTSEDAAKAIKPRVADIHRRILAAIELCAMTPDQCAEALSMTVLAVRPRFTELSAWKLIEKTGERRKNSSGQKANVYRLKDQ